MPVAIITAIIGGGIVSIGVALWLTLTKKKRCKKD
jgi:L-2-hydroxyglutarate oxidase LhgO